MTAVPLEPSALLDSSSHRLILKATLTPVAGLDRFQPAGFPEVGHVIYDAPRAEGKTEKVCIIDSAPSMANHLETVCQASAHDPQLVPALQGLPYLRCVTASDRKNLAARELVVTSLTEGHRLASDYFLKGFRVVANGIEKRNFADELHESFGLRKVGKGSHLLPDGWWKVFKTVFKYDPNSLVHGLLFPKWQIKLPRVLTAVHEGFGAVRVASSGVKFDRLGQTGSGQPIFAKDEETAVSIRATFIIDLGLLRSFGRGEEGLQPKQKELLLALCLWKIGALLKRPFRFRSGCDLECSAVDIELGEKKWTLTPADIDTDIASHVKGMQFEHGVTDIFWSQAELFKEPSAAEKSGDTPPDDGEDEVASDE